MVEKVGHQERLVLHFLLDCSLVYDPGLAMVRLCVGVGFYLRDFEFERLRDLICGSATCRIDVDLQRGNVLVVLTFVYALERGSLGLHNFAIDLVVVLDFDPSLDVRSNGGGDDALPDLLVDAIALAKGLTLVVGHGPHTKSAFIDSHHHLVDEPESIVGATIHRIANVNSSFRNENQLINFI